MAWKCSESELEGHSALWAFVIKGASEANTKESKEYVFASESKSEIDSWMTAFASIPEECGSYVSVLMLSYDSDVRVYT